MSTTRYAIIWNGRHAYTVATRRIANRIAANLGGQTAIVAVGA